MRHTLSAFILVGLLIPMSAKAQNTNVLIQTLPGASKIEAGILTSSFGAKLNREIPGLNASIYQVPDSQLGEFLGQLGNKNGVVTIEALTGDYRQLFKSVPTQTLNVGQAAIVETLRKQRAVAGVYVTQLRPSNISPLLLKGALSTADGFPTSKAFKVSLSPDLVVDATQTRLDEKSQSNFLWYGEVRRAGSPVGQRDGIASLAVNGDRINGTITVGSDVYTVSPVGGGVHAVVKNDPKAFPPEHLPNAPMPQNQPKTPATPEKRGDLQDAAPVTIRALVAYTPAVKLAVNNAGQTMDEFAEVAVQTTNSASIYSRVFMNLVLAGTAEVNYQESDIVTDLDRLAGKNDGFMDEIHARRASVQANVVFLLSTVSAACGQAKEILAKSDGAFAVVNYDCAWRNFSLAHEFGHLLGLRHDRMIDDDERPFKYGHGYVHGTEWRTIMAYPNACNYCQRIGIWSNPTVTYNGAPSGTADFENEARVINDTASDISKLH